jgi:phage regulator Rha-like protein
MNNLSVLTNQSTIKSTELVEIINEFRKTEGNKSELQHKTFMEKIRKEVETLKNLGLEGEQNFLPISYTDSQNRKKPCFELNRDGMLQMLNSESAFVRNKTIEYINKLEDSSEKIYIIERGKALANVQS